MNNKTAALVFGFILFALALASNTFAATSIELTTSDFINVFGNLNLVNPNKGVAINLKGC